MPLYNDIEWGLPGPEVYRAETNIRVKDSGSGLDVTRI